MKRTIVAVLAFMLVMAVAVPAFAATRSYGIGNGVAAGDVDRDRLQDGTGTNCPDGECTAPQDGTGSQARNGNQGSVVGQRALKQDCVASQEASGKPEWAGNPATPTANAQRVLAENQNRFQNCTHMPEDVRTKLVELMERIMERLRAMFGQG